MTKILASTDTINLIKTGCNQTNNLITPNLNTLKKDILTVETNLNEYKNLSSFKAYFTIKRTGKLYQVKIPKYSYNTTTACIKTLDNKNLQCIPSTNLIERPDDYSNIPLFKWWRCNYTRDTNGNPIITAIENTNTFTTTGDIDIGTFGMPFYWSYIDGSDSNYSSLNLDSNYYYLTISDSPNTDWNLQLWVGCKDHTGNNLGYWLYSSYNSITVNGKLRSQAGSLPTTGYTLLEQLRDEYQKKGTGYQGSPIDRTTFAYIFYLIKYGDKNTKTYFNGNNTSSLINTGLTDSVLRKHDGFVTTNSSYRIQGIEYGIWGTIASNVLINQETTNLRRFFVAPRGNNWTVELKIDMQAGSSYIDYSQFNEQSVTSNIFDKYIGDVFITNDGIIIPISSSTSTSFGTGDYTNSFDKGSIDQAFGYTTQQDPIDASHTKGLCCLYSYAAAMTEDAISAD